MENLPRRLENITRENFREHAYLENNPDVARAVSAKEFRSGYHHFRKFGRREGRQQFTEAFLDSQENPSVMYRRKFSEMIHRESTGPLLEIGPFNRPLIFGPQCKYFDIYPAEKLREKATELGLDPQGVPEIHFQDPFGDLQVIHEKFSSIVSAHCLEHQPDLIGHLNQVSALLAEKGDKYWLVLPDHRYCFDHFLPESKLTEVIVASSEKRKIPRAGQILENLALSTHNDSVRHWNGDHGEKWANLKARWLEAETRIKDENGNYMDVHCWQFTPESFSDLIGALNKLELIDFVCQRIYPTLTDDLEFFAVLEKV